MVSLWPQILSAFYINFVSNSHPLCQARQHEEQSKETAVPHQHWVLRSWETQQLAKIEVDKTKGLWETVR
jgi:hypothetical protein